LVPKDFVSTRPGPAGTPELVVLAPQSMPYGAYRALPDVRSRAPSQRQLDGRWVQACFSVPPSMAAVLSERLRVDGLLVLGHGMHATVLVGGEHIRMVRMREIPSQIPEDDIFSFLTNSGRSGAYPFSPLSVARVWAAAGTTRLPTADVHVVISCPDGSPPPVTIYLLEGRHEGRKLELVDPEPTAAPRQLLQLAAAITAWRSHGGPPPPDPEPSSHATPARAMLRAVAKRPYAQVASADPPSPAPPTVCGSSARPPPLAPRRASFMP
jgi:hypothetical protein